MSTKIPNPGDGPVVVTTPRLGRPPIEGGATTVRYRLSGPDLVWLEGQRKEGESLALCARRLLLERRKGEG